jgi:serine/threonine protein kinase
MPSLFISYRRGDSPDTVKLLHERLTKRLPRWEIFYDHESIPLGDPFPERLRAKVMAATAVLVIIGPKWLQILRERKGAPIDHVREEVRLGMEAGASVVPVLVGHAAMPTDADLADFADLQPLLKRNGRPVRPDPDFDSDLEPIVAHLKSLDAAEAVGTILDDKYTLTAEIGDGGMGVVYAAQQKKPVQRMVAVKLIKPGMDSRDVLARFDAERQALAVMDHPNVAKVLDAGMTPHGRPYFVMEYVKGVPITQYCDDKKLNPQERLNLFIPVCNAVQHAHQKGIIHRDLKPSNVLVEVVDGNPVPKVIDFGLAKALGQKLTDKTLHTALEMRVGTLEYSAPEQAAGRSFDVDTRSDIYSLGVLLYELLTGAPPFTHEELLKVGEEEMRRVIREDEPVKPSKKLSSSGELPAIAANRHLEPNKLTRMVQGDLDWIVMKCLEKERARRYDTANQLGDELKRFLADEPVQAGPPSAGYRARKFLRRNRGPAVAAGLVALALVGGIIGTSIGFAVAREAAALEKVATKKALDAGEEERKAKIAAQESEKNEKVATQKANEAADLAKKEKLAGDRIVYVSQMHLAQEARQRFDMIHMREALGKLMPDHTGNIDLRGWEWHHLKREVDAEQKAFTGHSITPWRVCYSPDGKYLASGSASNDQGELRLWNSQDGKVLFTFPGETKAVHYLGFHPDADNPQFVSCATDFSDNPAEVKLWDAKTGKMLRRLPSHLAAGGSVLFSHDGRHVFSIGTDAKTRMWRLDTAQEIRSFVVPRAFLGVGVDPPKPTTLGCS